MGEKIFADFFITRFNKHYSLSYATHSNENESVSDTDVDIYATAKNGGILKLQIKTGEPAWEAFWGSRIRHGSGMAVIDVNIPKLLSGIINTAELKYPNKNDLVLLIGEKMQPIFDTQFAQLICRPFKDSGFKGIYLIKLPFDSGIPPYEGQVVAIKGIFGNNGETF